jgi:PAS domain S-box-containing protein
MLLNARQIQRVLGKERIILLAIEDITERREIEAGLEKTRKELAATKISEDEAREYAEGMIHTVRDPLIALDKDLRIVTVSRSFYEFFKVKPEETVGHLIYDLGNKQWDIPKLRELLETILPEKTTFDNYEVEHDFTTIGRRIMLLNARQIQRLSGKDTIILLVIEDITERKKLEEAHSKLAAIVESADDAIIGKDLEGNITSWNNGAEAIYGYNAKEILGKSLSLLMPPGHSEEDKELLTKRSSVELIKNYETQRRRKDGKIIDISLTISPIKDSSEKIIGSSTIARDISEKKKLESVVVNAKNTAEATNKELEAFSYSVSHDLRAPLRSIDGFSQALLEDYSGKLDATGRNYLDKIRKATQHMGLLIDDMLKLSRVTRAEFKRESVDLSKMVRAIILTLRQNNPARDVKISIQKDIIIDGDRYLLEIALTNLIDNAWKFTGKQKHPHVEFGATLKENEKIFFIRDNGVGFDMSYVGKLFGAFQRLHTADEFAGTGIGLATVQRIINRHGGKIWAEGEVGKGATFYFTIP